MHTLLSFPLPSSVFFPRKFNEKAAAAAAAATTTTSKNEAAAGSTFSVLDFQCPAPVGFFTLARACQTASSEGASKVRKGGPHTAFSRKKKESGTIKRSGKKKGSEQQQRQHIIRVQLKAAAAAAAAGELTLARPSVPPLFTPDFFFIFYAEASIAPFFIL